MRLRSTILCKRIFCALLRDKVSRSWQGRPRLPFPAESSVSPQPKKQNGGITYDNHQPEGLFLLVQTGRVH